MRIATETIIKNADQIMDRLRKAVEEKGKLNSEIVARNDDTDLLKSYMMKKGKKTSTDTIRTGRTTKYGDLSPEEQNKVDNKLNSRILKLTKGGKNLKTGETPLEFYNGIPSVYQDALRENKLKLIKTNASCLMKRFLKYLIGKKS